MGINRVSISGNLTRDAELRATQSGMQIMSFGVAVNDRRKNPATGEWEDYPNYVDCTMFGTRAGKLQPYMTKGTKVAVDGKLRYSSWEKDGQKRSKLEVIAEELEFMSSRRDGQQAPQQAYAPYQNAPAAPQPAPQAPAPAPQAYAPQQAPQQAYAPQQMDMYDSDIPF